MEGTVTVRIAGFEPEMSDFLPPHHKLTFCVQYNEYIYAPGLRTVHIGHISQYTEYEYMQINRYLAPPSYLLVSLFSFLFLT